MEEREEKVRKVGRKKGGGGRGEGEKKGEKGVEGEKEGEGREEEGYEGEDTTISCNVCYATSKVR